MFIECNFQRLNMYLSGHFEEIDQACLEIDGQSIVMNA